MSYSVIGLGNCGDRIADEFKALDSNLKVFKIDCEKKIESGYLKITKRSDPEKYEANPPSVKDVERFLKNLDEEVLFIVGGSGDISAVTLRILEQIKEKSITVLYIKPDLDFLPKVKKLHERSTFHILQEYARSGMFRDIYLISNTSMEEVVGDVNIKDVMKTINQTIAWTYHTARSLKSSESLMDNFSPPAKGVRIKTLGTMDLKTGEEKLYFPIDNVAEKEYYYSYQREEIETNNKLFKEIKNQLKEKKTDETQIYYGVYSSEYPYEKGICLFRSAMIQDG